MPEKIRYMSAEIILGSPVRVQEGVTFLELGENIIDEIDPPATIYVSIDGHIEIHHPHFAIPRQIHYPSDRGVFPDVAVRSTKTDKRYRVEYQVIYTP